MIASFRRISFRSLRWRIATFYALLLLCVIGIVAIVLTFELRSILLDEARAKIDGVGSDIEQQVRTPLLGDNASIAQQFATIGGLDHWAGPTTFVEVDTLEDYPIGKSTNMGSASFDIPSAKGESVSYHIINNAQLGDLLVRSETIRESNVAIVVVVGESLSVFDQTLGRIRGLLALIVSLSVVVVIAGSFAIASSAIEPINRLIAAMGKTRSDMMNERLGMSERDDEIGSLANSFDAMLDRLEDGFARERQFISDASHELKTPLTVINANAQMLERWADRDPEIRADSLRAIREESGSLAAMVNGMLLLAKAESGDDIPRTSLALEQPLHEAVRITSQRAEEKGIALLSTFDAEGDTRIFGDGSLLRQLFTNLIDNAIKFTEQGSVTVALRVLPEAAIVTVSDTGVGIDDEALERVFDRFFRTDASRNRAVPGTGLGLAIVRSIARVHGGTVVAARRPEGGTVFTVSIPMLTYDS